MSEIARAQVHWMEVEPLYRRVLEARGHQKTRSAKDAMNEVLTYIRDSSQYESDFLAEHLNNEAQTNRFASEKVECLQVMLFNGAIARKTLKCAECGTEAGRHDWFCKRCGVRFTGVLPLRLAEEEAV